MNKISKMIIIVGACCLMLSACTPTKKPEEEKPMTTDLEYLYIVRYFNDQGDNYSGNLLLNLTMDESSIVNDLLKTETWTAIFKPTSTTTTPITLADSSENTYEFGLYDEKMLVVITIKNKLFYYEGDKQIYLDLKEKVTEFDQHYLPEKAHLDAVFTSTIAKDYATSVLSENIKLDPLIKTEELNAVLKREAWIKLEVVEYVFDPALSLVDSQGQCYTFSHRKDGQTSDHVSIYPTCNSGSPTLTYAVPDGVIDKLQTLVSRLFSTEIPTEAFIATKFDRAYVGMTHGFLMNDMLEEYFFTLTPDQIETINKIDLSKWIKLTFPVYDEKTYDFALYDTQDNAFYFSGTNDVALVKFVSVLDPEIVEFYYVKGMDVNATFQQLVDWYEPKGVLSEITKVTFKEVYTSTDETDFVLLTTLTKDQSNALIEVMDYAAWKQKVAEEGRGITYGILLVTTTGLHYYFGFEARIELADGSYRCYDMTNETWNDLYNFVQSLKK